MIEIKKAREICEVATGQTLYTINKYITPNGANFICAALTGWPAALDEIDRLQNLLNNANQALKRAGSSAQFHLKADEEPAETIVFEEKEHPEDVFVRQHIEELNQRIDRLRAENIKLKTDADKWRQLIKKAGKVGLSEADLFKMVTPIQYVESEAK